MFNRIAVLVLAGVLAPWFISLQAQERSPQGSDSPPSRGAPPNSISNAQAVAVTFELKRTSLAPEGAVGSAELKNGRLSIHLSQLGSGDYVVEGLGPELVPYRLGVVVITDPTGSPDRIANDNKKEASAHPESTHLEADVKMTLPVELQSLQVTHLRLLGPGRNAVLEGTAKPAK